MIHRPRTRPRVLARRSAAVLVALCLAACTGGEDSGGGPLLDEGNLGGNSGLLAVEGPDGAPSGALTVEAGSRTEGFVASLRSASGRALDGVFVSLRADRGSIVARRPGGGTSLGGAATDAGGEVAFAFLAPETVSDVTEVLIRASARIPNSTPTTSDDAVEEAEYMVVVVPALPLELTLTGPADVAPGVENAGFVATLRREDGSELPDACVTLTASSGTIAPAAQTCDDGRNGYLTDDLGRVAFRLRPPANAAADSTITITAEAAQNGQTARRTLSVTVRPDTFQFTAPAPNAAILVGAANAEPVQLQWTRAPSVPGGGSGVAGSVTLSTTRGFFVVNGAAQPAGQTVTVATDAGAAGGLADDVRIASTTGGSATLTAASAAAGRSATTTVRFVDTAGEINLDAQPLIVQCSPNSNRFSTLTVTVLNGAGAPAAGVPVEFALLAGAGGANERLFPTRQTTDAQGVASSRYEAGTAAGTARVQAVVTGGGQSNIREIQVQSPAAGGGAACS